MTGYVFLSCINCEYIRQRCMNQKIKYRKYKITITDFISDAPLIYEEAEQYVLDSGSIYIEFYWGKTGVR